MLLTKKCPMKHFVLALLIESHPNHRPSNEPKEKRLTFHHEILRAPEPTLELQIYIYKEEKKTRMICH